MLLGKRDCYIFDKQGSSQLYTILVHSPKTLRNSILGAFHHGTNTTEYILYPVELKKIFIILNLCDLWLCDYEDTSKPYVFGPSHTV